MENLHTPQSKKNEGKEFWPFVFLFVGLIVVDQLSKNFVHPAFRNYVFAFSLPLPLALIYLVYIIVIAAMLYYVTTHNKNFSNFTSFAWTLVFAGALSNIIERMALGYVRDFIYISFYRWTGIYNIADFYILLGILLLLIGDGK